MKNTSKKLLFNSKTITELNTSKMSHIRGGSPIDFGSSVRCIVDAIVKLTSDNDNDSPGCLTV